MSLVLIYPADILSSVTCQLMEVLQHSSYERRDIAFPQVVSRSQIHVGLHVNNQQSIALAELYSRFHHRLDEPQGSLKLNMHLLTRQVPNPWIFECKLNKISYYRQ